MMLFVCPREINLPQTSRIRYRIDQFRRVLHPSLDAVPVDILRDHLNPAQLTLFLRMQPSERAHAFQVFQELQEAGYKQPELLAAALLHDVGKILYPLLVWERVAIVLGYKFFPRLARRLGRGKPRGLRRPFVIATQHPAWGADLVAQTGAGQRTLDLIRHHQDKDKRSEIPLLGALQDMDDSN
jgi:hypothetical protein